PPPEAPMFDVGGEVDSEAAGPPAAAEPAAEEPAAEDGDVRPATVQRIAALNVAERMKLAMKGTREERAVLIRDPNKIVAVAVLSSPKLTETEVEYIAKMANVSDEILRMIGFSRAWTKN